MAKLWLRPYFGGMNNTTAPSSTQPVLFISHGAPTLALAENVATQAWREIGRSLVKPRAVLVASAHHDAPGPMLTANPSPATIHDFYGFPRELYDVRYPAAGAPDVVNDVRELLLAAGVTPSVDPLRGIDHGVWVPLLRLFPEADVPVISMSIDSGRDAAWHQHVGASLSALRQQGVLVVGSGSLTHNLRATNWQALASAGSDRARAFADWVQEKLAIGDQSALLDWSQAPEAGYNHPTPEHWMPFYVALGAAQASAAPAVHAAIFEYDVLSQHAFAWH